MFIELTDHLRCPADHPESYLVLIPGAMEGRRVFTGTLGCPVCRAEYRITHAIPDFFQGAWSPLAPGDRSMAAADVDAQAILAFLGLEGPGGYLGLVGDAVRFAAGLLAALPGVHLVAINPPEGSQPSADVSIVQSPRIPLKARALRGMVLGLPFAGSPEWQAGAIRAVLPGLRAAGEGPVPVLEGFELLGAADGWWVGRPK
jgi:uncharacterized protein YbaR (Trm112 family)